jgi:hypothetical protein
MTTGRGARFSPLPIRIPRRAPRIHRVSAGEKLSDQLERWLRAEGPKTLGSLIDALREKGFAAVFVVLMATPALPLPTGGVTHVLEVITMLVALEMIVGRRAIWLPERWRQLEVVGSGQRFAGALLRYIRWFERLSRPRLRPLLRHPLTNVVFGVLVFALSLTAFLAPPFSGLDTLPSLGVVVLSLGVLLGDFVLALAGLFVGALGVLLVIAFGELVFRLVRNLLGVVLPLFASGSAIAIGAVAIPGPGGVPRQRRLPRDVGAPTHRGVPAHLRRLRCRGGGR